MQGVLDKFKNQFGIQKPTLWFNNSSWVCIYVYIFWAKWIWSRDDLYNYEKNYKQLPIVLKSKKKVNDFLNWF